MPTDDNTEYAWVQQRRTCIIAGKIRYALSIYISSTHMSYDCKAQLNALQVLVSRLDF